MLEVKIEEDYDIGAARRAITEFALIVSFSELELAELAIIITEMSTNLVRHARCGGMIRYDLMPELQGVVLEAVNSGPSSYNTDIFLVSDGVSTQRGGIGGGLGAIQRLSDSFTLKTDETGTRVRVTKVARNAEIGKLKVSVCSRPYPGFDVNGDGFYIYQGGTRSIIAVYDALGHGKEAYETSCLLYKCLLELHGLELSDIVTIAHQRLLRSRGVALWLGAVYHNEKKMSYISLGNIEGRLLMPGQSQTLLSQNGTVGHYMPKCKVNEVPWNSGAVLAIATDGISNRWQVQDYPELWGTNSSLVCQRVLTEWGRTTDDATMMIVRNVE